MIDERELAIHPLVPDSIGHNTRTLSNIRALTASLFGIAAGILGLESWPGFLFYFLGTLLISALIWALRIKGEGKSSDGLFYRPLTDLLLGDVVGNLMGFVLTWTLFYGLVRA